MEKKKWYNQKTTRAGIAAILVAAGGVLTGELSVAVGLQLGFAAFIGMFLRQGIENAKKE